MRFGEFLVANKLLDQSAVDEGLSIQRYKKALLGRTLRDLGFIDQRSLNQILTGYLKPELILDASELGSHFEKSTASDEVKKWSWERDVIPFSEATGGIEFLATDFRDEIIEEGERMFPCLIKLSTVSEEIFQYAKKLAFKDLKESLPRSRLTLSQTVTDDAKIAGESPYVRLYRECIETAKRESVSDIHFEPKPDSIQIRFRLHGDLMLWKVLTKEHRDALISKVKWLTNLDLSVSGRPQDSRATYYDLNLNLRVNAIPSRHGDKIVIRILDQDKKFDIDKVGLTKEAVLDLKRVANFSNGLIIISGPTGSGKTTTLYGLINSLDHFRKNITTLEDPSEYELSGVTQKEIGKHLTFPLALKALLRQDPDVILLGEIRDEETAKLSFKIANTGHLVITTLHSNGALESIERLKTMGVDDFSIESCIRMTGAQRLLQALCPRCSTELRTLNGIAETLAPLEKKFGKGCYRMKNGGGCEQCIKGICGRVPILEYALSEEVGPYVREKKKCLRISLTDAAFKLAKEGGVDVRDALQVQ